MTDRQCFRAFAAASGGTSATEFAFIAPILVALFMIAIELPRAITTGARLSSAADVMADLTASGDSPDLADIFSAAQAVATPYDVSAAGIVLTAGGVYQVGDDFVARVCSSAQRNGQARAVGSTIGTAPAGLTTNGARFVMAEVTMRYAALFAVLPVINNWTYSYKVVWPVRDGKTYSGQPEVVLPNGRSCPAQ